jgi:hypothetical protein
VNRWLGAVPVALAAAMTGLFSAVMWADHGAGWGALAILLSAGLVTSVAAEVRDAGR